MHNIELFLFFLDFLEVDAPRTEMKKAHGLK